MSSPVGTDFIESCRKKASQLPDEKMQTVLTRSFSALKSLSGSRVENLEYLLETMRTERVTARKYDTRVDSDALRGFIYDINEAIEKTIENMMEKVKSNHTAMAPIQDFQDQKDYMGMEVDPAPIINVQTGRRSQFTQGSVNMINVNQLNRMAPANDRNRSLSVVNHPNGQVYRLNATSSGNVLIRAEPRNGVTAATNGLMTPHSSFASPMGLNQVMGAEPRGPKKDPVRSLNCHQCIKRGMTISSFVKHLSDKHKTTPAKARISFGCACGYVATNYTDVRLHNNGCSSSGITVIKRPVHSARPTPSKISRPAINPSSAVGTS
ncbi:hypothetical protein PENTCL1PPCAC_7368 [Pristionchus entomophagus]|uniref:Uncharacterized protein n=1 Tax=Pristionchus entomophagus TaxID=358040 RepID=A0AAV5SSX4_9BILA|nr:hypothetical protein PENTCL1PPCAC_7368 [Pristionchus entomophagus]